MPRGIVEKWSAYSYKVPLCVPYWNQSTYWHLLKNILTGQVLDGASVHQLKKVLSESYSVSDMLLCTSGRVAIGLALRSFGIQDSQEIVVPSFCCQSIIDPILEVGARPVFADVGDEVNVTVEAIEACLTKNTAAVLVPHLFGNPADIVKIVDLCHARGVMVIDDAAQALGATVNGRCLGTFGDAGVVSFGNGKVCFGIGGGFLLSRHPHVLETATALARNPSGSSKLISHAASVLMWRRWRRWTLPLDIVLSRFRKGQKEQPTTHPTESMRNLEASVALTLLQTLQDNLRRRREHIERYKENLGQHPQVTLMPHAQGSSHLAQVIQIQPSPSGDSRRDHVIRTLKNKGFEVTASFTPLHLLPRYRSYATGPLHNIERKWQHLVELPAEPSVHRDDIDHISATLIESLGR